MPRRKPLRRSLSCDSNSIQQAESSDSADSEYHKKTRNKPKAKKDTDALSKMTSALAKGIQPLKIDSTVRFAAVGGLDEHIKCLREMVLFPLMYPNFFKRFNTQPPKGVLFHGPPGTGKTLLARALANECGVLKGRKVSFFMRKGADVMDKFYGESEKLLKTLFQKASKMRPAIIFFDEIDALAPIRTDVNSEAYTSIVATLLSEMDGLLDRGEVIVIGATNRPDAIDPALRRPGRLDRELYFPPPNIIARREILEIYTAKWVPRPSDETLNHIAAVTSGYLGSDLNALCTEAVLKALKRVYPQVYEEDYRKCAAIDTRLVSVTKEDLLAAKRVISPASARSAPLAARNLPAHFEPLLGEQINAAAIVLKVAFPRADVRSPPSDNTQSPSVFLVCGECSETYIAPALLTQLEHCAIKELSMATIHSSRAGSQEQAIISAFGECRRADRDCVIFIRDILAVWESLEKSQCTSLLSQLWRTRAAGDCTLLFATSNVRYHELPEEVQILFPLYKDCLYNVRQPYQSEVINFLKPIISELNFDEQFKMPEEEVDIGGAKDDPQASDPEVNPLKSSSNTTNLDSINLQNGFSSTTQTSGYIGTAQTNGLSSSAQNKFMDSRKRRLLELQQKAIAKKPRLSDWRLDMSTHDPAPAVDNLLDDSAPITREAIEKVLTDNAEAFQKVGLEALIDLYEQLKRAIQREAKLSVRAREFQTIAARYVKMVKSYI